MKTLDLVQTLELRSEIQRLILSHVKSARTGPAASTSATNAMYHRIQDSQNDSFYGQEQYFSQQSYTH